MLRLFPWFFFGLALMDALDGKWTCGRAPVGDKSRIEWTEATWNPVTGCSKVSPGCAHCYAETLALTRLAGKPGYLGLPWTPENAAENVVLRPDRLDQPIKWQRSRMIFVNSMSDLFHELVPDEFIARVFGAMVAAPQHTFQVLTKRPERMRDLLSGTVGESTFWPLVWECYSRLSPDTTAPVRMTGENLDQWMLTNCWLGTSIENRRYVHRADLLRETPAAVRFISAEPLLGPLVNVAIRRDQTTFCDCEQGAPTEHQVCLDCGDDVPGCSCDLDLTGIDWLIVGGESGPEHRPMRVEWVRDLLLAAQTRCPLCLNGVALEPDGWTHNCEPGYGTPRCERTAFFFKQWGGRTPKAGGRLLSGRTWDEMPAAPAVAA